jgi:hypothetical protein
MALIQLGSIVHAASGALGGVCFSRQAGAPIVRVRPIWRPGSSAAVLAQQAVFAQARAAWQNLLDADRLTWIRLAPQLPFTNRLGATRQLSPFNLFTSCAIRNLNAGLNIYTRPTTSHGITSPHAFTVEIWPNGPANLIAPTTEPASSWHITIKAQRTFHTHPGLPGQLWRAISQPELQQFAVNFWPQLIAAFGTPARLEWYRLQVTQWYPGWPRALDTAFHIQIPSVGDELITNGDFETGGIPPPGWQVLGTGVLAGTKTDPYADDNCARWTVAAAQPITRCLTATANYFSLTGGAAYTFRFAYRFNSGTVSYVQILGTGMSNVTLYTNLTDATGQWITGHAHFTPDSNATACYLRFYNAASVPVNLHLDNVSIRKDTP